MKEIKQRSEAQKAADARYAAKNADRYKTVSFRFLRAEADELERAITATGLSKADFLRLAVKKLA